ncbi:hypothetical protein GGS20DRAFT_579353 [Poronia punctata]|nr:hypothetical protein GGS20DRAFT_579353 [Poronia punctata]
MSVRLLGALLLFGVQSQRDNIGLEDGFLAFNTTNFNAKIARAAQVLVSLGPAARANNGQYHWGDVTFRHRQQYSEVWVDGDSATSREPVESVATGALMASNLAATLGSGPLNVTREWLDVAGDLGLGFTIGNTGTSTIELGSLGFPAEFNSLFTNRSATDIQRLCSLSDPYVGMHAGYIRANPVSGTGAALVATPLGGTDTPFEAYRNLDEPSYSSTNYGSQTFEGFYEWQVFTKAWAEREWNGVSPWNRPSSRTLVAGQSIQFGLRFSVSKAGVRGLEDTVLETGTLVAVGVPDYIIPRGSSAQLFLRSSSSVSSISSEPPSALAIELVSDGSYAVTPSQTVWGRVRLTIAYTDEKMQTVHYHVTKASTEALSDLGVFLTTKQWFNDSSDPFGRAHSVMTYDYEAGDIVVQDPRVWIGGLSDEGRVGAYLAAVVKQAIHPNAGEVAKLERFVDEVLWGTIQTSDFAVRKSIFYYDKSALPNYPYKTEFDWGSWTSWNKASAYAIDRAYDYVHVAAAYWSLYRVARAYPKLVKYHDWDWYLCQAYNTIIRATKPGVGYSDVGLMGETVYGEILTDLTREGKTDEASVVVTAMKSRATKWSTQEVPYGSRWPGTPQGKSIYGGKLQCIERQISHYGSGLNAPVLLSAFHSDSSDLYLFQVGYGGTSGPLSNINQDGFASAAGAANSTSTVRVTTHGPVRRRVFIGPLAVLITTDAGSIVKFNYSNDRSSISLALAQIVGGPSTTSAVLEFTRDNCSCF